MSIFKNAHPLFFKVQPTLDITTFRGVKKVVKSRSSVNRSLIWDFSYWSDQQFKSLNRESTVLTFILGWQIIFEKNILHKERPWQNFQGKFKVRVISGQMVFVDNMSIVTLNFTRKTTCPDMTRTFDIDFSLKMLPWPKNYSPT